MPQVAAGGGDDPADRESALHGYFREVRPFRTLTAAGEGALPDGILHDEGNECAAWELTREALGQAR